MKHRSQKSPDSDDDNLLNKFSLDSPDDSSDELDLEDECGEEADKNLPPPLMRCACDPKHHYYSDDVLRNAHH